MKRVLAPLLLLLLLCACAPATGAESGASEGYRKISPDEAYEMMTSQEVTVVDVRTEEEYSGGHIPEAILVPNENIGQELPEALPDTDAVLLVYCRSGRRSKEAAEKLIALGYTNVFDFGGIVDWPYDIVTE